jgi:hypothetical protein
MLCPNCASDGFEAHEDEVDIGVGVQVYCRGGCCRNCGELSLCDFCGAWEKIDAQGNRSMTHATFCTERQP